MLISTHVNTAHLLPRISVGCVMFFALAFCSILHATESETKEEKAPTTLSLEARILNAQQTLNKLNQAL
ncbi:MAG: phospholipase, partial [Glaciecola sp.]